MADKKEIGSSLYIIIIENGSGPSSPVAAALFGEVFPGCLSLFSNSLLATTWAPSLPQGLGDYSNCFCCRRRELVAKEGGGREELHLVSRKIREQARVCCARSTGSPRSEAREPWGLVPFGPRLALGSFLPLSEGGP